MTGGPRRIRLLLAYDGTDFHGWQVQPGLRSVQGVVGDALSRLQSNRPVKLRGAGRTDAGVHAMGQVADAEVSVDDGDAQLHRALDRMLPADVRVEELNTVPAEFHSRRDAVEKTYRYRIDRSAHGDPFLARFAAHHPGPLDGTAMRDALSRLPGRRDWSGFTAASCEIDDRIRHLTRADYDVSNDAAWFVFAADGFLTHMVRNLVGTVLEIGRGRWTPDRIDRILDAADRRLAGPTAPARGLHLERVRYERDL